MKTVRNLIATTLTVATLSLWAVAEPTAQVDKSASVEQSVTTVIRSLEERPTLQQPLVTQEDVERDVKDAEVVDRPRGESRSARDKRSRSLEKPLLEVHGF